MLATAVVVVLFLARVASKAGFGNFLGRLVLERDDLGDIAAAFDVCAARAVALFAARHLSLPGGNLSQLGVCRVGEGFELIFVTSLTGVAADIVGGLVRR